MPSVFERLGSSTPADQCVIRLLFIERRKYRIVEVALRVRVGDARRANDLFLSERAAPTLTGNASLKIMEDPR